MSYPLLHLLFGQCDDVPLRMFYLPILYTYYIMCYVVFIEHAFIHIIIECIYIIYFVYDECTDNIIF